MRKWGALAIGGVLLISLATPVNAVAPKAGATCVKKNSTVTSAGKLYTCILSGKKLVWDKGVAIPKPTPTSTTQPSKQESQNMLSNDQRITPTSALSSISICKTEDMTPDYMEGDVVAHRNGFPRPALSMAGKKSAKVLIIPLSFNDLPFRDEKIQRGQIFSSDLDNVNQIIGPIREAYQRLSAKRFDVTFDILPKSQWWVIDMDNPFSGQWGVPNFPQLLSIISKQKANFKFEGYDSYAFITGNGMPEQNNIGSAQATFGTKLPNSRSDLITGILMVGNLNQATVWIHELGHSLFSFEDLYLFSDQTTSGPRERIPEISIPTLWDLMSDAKRPNLLEWNKFLAGWLYDSEVRCLTDQKSSVHYLSNITTSSDPKLLTINLAPGVTLAAQASYSATGPGLLLYTINTYIPHGEGPVQTLNTLVSKGQSKSWLGWQFNVLDTNNDGVLFEVVKTDVDKFVPPAKKPGPAPSSQQSSKIVVTKSEVVPNGFLKARATWQVQGYQSYRVYVTAVDDFQKVYFESGYVNDSRSPLVVDISGLVCNRELRTMVEFYSEKDAKGDRLTLENRQLSNLSCEDTTKKP